MQLLTGLCEFQAIQLTLRLLVSGLEYIQSLSTVGPICVTLREPNFLFCSLSMSEKLFSKRYNSKVMTTLSSDH